MDHSFGLFIRLFLLIVRKFVCFILLKAVAALFYAILLFRSMLSSLHKLGGLRKGKQTRVGLVLLTRFPVTERAALMATEQSSADQLLSGLAHASLIERILAEMASLCVASWLQLDSCRHNLHARLFLVYRKSYTSAFTISSWLSTLPNHSMARVWYDNYPKDTFDVAEHDQSLHESPTPTHAPDQSEFAQSRTMQILSSARSNASQRPTWEDPSLYCSSGMIKPSSDFARNILRTAGFSLACTKTKSLKVEYVGVAGLGFTELLEVSLQSALRTQSDYIIVLNPRALALRPEHINTAVQLLCGIDSDSVDVVLGVTKPCCAVVSPQIDSATKSTRRQSVSDSPSAFGSNPMGLYLLGIRATPSLTLRSHCLTAGVEWSASTTASRLWANLIAHASNWTAVCLRERLEEIMHPLDLLSLENQLGIPPQLFLQDTLSVIIPVGPGHPDDNLDEDDEELIDADQSRALLSTIEILAHNATGRRPIQVILIDSTPTTSASPPTPGDWSSSPFRGLRLRPGVSVSHQHFAYARDPSTTSRFILPPRRGELIRYAVEQFARGSTLVFLEPGIQLPQNWDSAVCHCLQRPDVGMGCFAYRLHLHDKYINRKSVSWAINCRLANYWVNVQTRRTQLPIVGQPLFIYTHYLACLGGYPQSSRALHPIDLALRCHQELGQLAITCPVNASAGVPADFALRHGAYRTTLYTGSIALARYFGASETELHRALSRTWRLSRRAKRAVEGEPVARLPLIRPVYLDGY